MAEQPFNIASVCPAEKLVYEACFTKWYAERFLAGETKLGCLDEFKAYQQCVLKHLRANEVDALLKSEIPAFQSDPLFKASSDAPPATSPSQPQQPQQKGGARARAS